MALIGVIFQMTTFMWAIAIAVLFLLIFRSVTNKATEDKRRDLETSNTIEVKEQTAKPKIPPLQTTKFETVEVQVQIPKIQDPLGVETLTNRRVKALYKLSTQVLEDDQVDLAETRKLRSWLRKYPESQGDWRTRQIYELVESVLEDRVLDHDEALEVFALLSEYCEYFELKTADETAKIQHAKVEKIQANAEKRAEKEKVREESTKTVYTLGNEVLLGQLEQNQLYAIGYRDSKGIISERHIVFKKSETNDYGQQYVKAICLLRNSLRTFRADRIQWMCDAETGEALM